jgi:hypothetical protein
MVYQRINRNTMASFLRGRSRMVWESKALHPLAIGDTYNVGRNAKKRAQRSFIRDLLARLYK